MPKKNEILIRCISIIYNNMIYGGVCIIANDSISSTVVTLVSGIL